MTCCIHNIMHVHGTDSDCMIVQSCVLSSIVIVIDLQVESVSKIT